MKRHILILLALLLLTGCEKEGPARSASTPAPAPTPTPSPTPTPEETAPPIQGIELDIGDGEHTFWVEAVDTGEPAFDGTVSRVDIYRDREDAEPFQTFEEILNKGDLEIVPIDVDFDGDTDFSVLLHDYRSFRYSAYYIWDGKRERFIEDPYGLNDLNRAEFDPESKTIETSDWSLMSGQTSYYRYEGNDLLCVRVLTWSFHGETGKTDLMVTDGWDGEETVVYEASAAMDELVEGMVGTEEFFRWEDLDYHGEE